jgi:hypothetical protein
LGGAGLAFYYPVLSQSIDRCVVAFNGPGDAIGCIESGNPLLQCTDIWGNTDGDWVGCISGLEGTAGNFGADPLFCDWIAGDLSLHSDSPCLPGNHPAGAACGLIGAFDVGCTVTSVPAGRTEEISWGALKKLFR